MDEGEKQAIALTLTIADKVLLLVDDRLGRRVAQQLGIATTGSIGLLLRMKEKGLIENVSELMGELRDRGYWLSDRMIEVAKQLAGED